MKNKLILLMKIGKNLYEYKNNNLIKFDDNQYNSLGLNYPYMVLYADNFLKKDNEDLLLMLSFDTKQRLQYKYSSKRGENSVDEKINILKIFINNYKTLVNNIKKDLSNNELNEEKILAAMCYLLITTGIRVGKDVHYYDYGTIGLSTLRLKDITFIDDKEQILLSFIGKKGVYHEYIIDSSLIYNIFDELKELNKNNNNNTENFLFFYNNKKINYNDLNNYIKKKSLNDNLTSKDFRTLIGNITYLDTLLELIYEKNEKGEKINLDKIIKEAQDIVSETLHNTKSVAKKYYVFSIINDFFKDNIDNIDYLLEFKDSSIKLLELILNKK